MGFATEAIRHFLTVVIDHYSDFRGRASRRDFWTYIAVYLTIAVLLALVRPVVGVNLVPLLHLGLLLPTASIIARRLQDTGKTGALIWLIMIIPLLIAMAASFALLGLAYSLIGTYFTFFAVLPLVGAATSVPSTLSLGFAVAAIYLTALCLKRGTPGPNLYGPPPPAAV